jgi:hypothetical protein
LKIDIPTYLGCLFDFVTVAMNKVGGLEEFAHIIIVTNEIQYTPNGILF